METINLFFSCDENYVPFLGVTLESLKENRNPARRYEIRILHTGLGRASMERVTESFASENFDIGFVNITSQVERFTRRLHTRDYYSKSTYYRLFIPEMFPQLDKALYLDSDLVVRGDISELYDTPLGDNLVGAIPDGFVNAVGELREYVCRRLNLNSAELYFNAGILLMNLKAMRQFRFQEVFLELLGAVTFQVAQDQDYQNAICRGRVAYIDPTWNAMPDGRPVREPKLVHYNVDAKPWHKDHVRYGDYFWNYADRSPYSREIRKIRSAYSEADTEKSARETVNLIAMATRQAHEKEENRRIHAEIDRVVGQ